MLIKETKEDNKFECCFIELYLKVIIIYSKIKHISRKKTAHAYFGRLYFSKFFRGKIKDFYMHLHRVLIFVKKNGACVF